MTINEGSEKLSAALAGVEQPIDGPPATTAADPMQKYDQERIRRLKPEGITQYIDLATSDKFREYRDDPWLEEEGEIVPALKDGGHCKYLIFGAGFGGLLFAINLIKAGVDVKDIYILDSAGGFGGTWYWNRYPGLMCDVESYIYLPLLEDTGYMPKHKYAYGPEIRDYANKLADQFGLRHNASFQMQGKELRWDESSNTWVASLTHAQTSSNEGTDLTVTAQFVIAAGGLLNNPKLPGVDGIKDFQGHSFHSSRWDYKFTGGTPSDPTLANLQGKSVGIIGTGATCIQVLPQLAKWAKEVYVFQRTPSSVDVRQNSPTDPDWFNEQVGNKKGWQRERATNFNLFVTNTNPKPDVDLINDGWSKIAAYSALIGGPAALTLTPEGVPAYIGALHAMDYPRQESIRQRVASIVKDPSTAEKLKPYYPSWCKRPAFHDDFLLCFNQPNVHLIDVSTGKGVEKLTSTALITNGTEYPLDCLIYSTGFRSPSVGSPAARAGLTIIGRNGLSLDQKWTDGVATLHGVCSHDFPNLFWPGPIQAGATANQIFVLDTLAEHVAFIIAAAEKRPGGKKKKMIIEPSKEAEEEWTMRIAQLALSSAPIIGCTPGYLNAEGEMDKVMGMGVEAQMKAARGGIWGAGINNYVRVIGEWREDGGLQGLEVKVV
jgi:cation diffusion facilitator CzcD-associated flavoprotein CzcO